MTEDELQESYGNQFIFERAAIGRVMLISESEEYPDDWHECDGSVLASFRYPIFVERMGITEPTFTLIKPERLAEGKRFVMKLGPMAEV